MASESTVSRVYAEALFAIANERDDRAELDQELRDLAKVFRENKDIKNFFASPGTPRDDKIKLIDTVFKPNLNSATVGFMHLLVRKGREMYLERILTAYEKLVHESEGRVEVEITSAKPLTAELLASLETQLKKAHGDKLQIESSVDERLIAGMQVRVGDRLLDTSVRSRLLRLREAILAG